MWFLRYIPSENHREKNNTHNFFNRKSKKNKTRKITVFDVLKKKQRTKKTRSYLF
jgi:hypothetical protein